MKIGIDSRMISHPGIGRYVESLLTSMVTFFKDEFVLFGCVDELEKFCGKNVKIIAWNKPIYSLKEQICLPYAKENIDLLHVPHFNVPIFGNTKFIVTIHDLIYLTEANSIPNNFAYYYAKFMIGCAVKQSEKIIAVSNNTKEDILRIFGDKYRSKIEVVYEAADPVFQKISDESVLDEARQKYNLPKEFILYLGSIKPHKNVESVIKAYIQLKNKNIRHKLVLAGKWDEKQDYLRKYLNNEDILYIGEIDDVDVPVLYNLAQVLVHVSFIEGFGLTPLEAMQSGTPVVVSNVSSIPEVVGKGANLVDPEDIGQIADTVYNVLANEKFRNQTIEYGINRAKEFSWELAGEQTNNIYNSILS